MIVTKSVARTADEYLEAINTNSRNGSQIIEFAAKSKLSLVSPTASLVLGLINH